MKDFRQNLASYTQSIQKGGIKYIVLKKNIPIIEIRAIDEKQIFADKFKRDLAKAEKEADQGKTYSQEEVMKEFGLL